MDTAVQNSVVRHCNSSTACIHIKEDTVDEFFTTHPTVWYVRGDWQLPCSQLVEIISRFFLFRELMVSICITTVTVSLFSWGLSASRHCALDLCPLLVLCECINCTLHGIWHAYLCNAMHACCSLPIESSLFVCLHEHFTRRKQMECFAQQKLTCLCAWILHWLCLPIAGILHV